MALLNPTIVNELRNIEATSYKPIDPGKYTMNITKAVIKAPAKDPNGTIVNVEFTILGPSFQGRKIYDNFNLVNRSPEAERIGKEHFKNLIAAALHKEAIEDTDELIGAKVIAKVDIDKPREGYDPQNRIKSYQELENVGNINFPTAPTDAVPQGNSFSEAFAGPQPTTAGEGWGTNWGN